MSTITSHTVFNDDQSEKTSLEILHAHAIQLKEGTLFRQLFDYHFELTKNMRASWNMATYGIQYSKENLELDPNSKEFNLILSEIRSLR